MPAPEDPLDSIRRDCWDHAIQTFGTAHIFERRVRRLQGQLRALSFVSLGVPLIVGSVVLSFGKDTRALPWIILTAGILGTLQVAVSLWSLVSKWSDNCVDALESVSVNHRLSSDYADLGKHPSADPVELKRRFDTLRADDARQSARDLKQEITEKEKRVGLRAGLRQYQRRCAACEIVPQSLAPSTCPTCGQF